MFLNNKLFRIVLLVFLCAACNKNDSTPSSTAPSEPSSLGGMTLIGYNTNVDEAPYLLGNGLDAACRVAKENRGLKRGDGSAVTHLIRVVGESGDRGKAEASNDCVKRRKEIIELNLSSEVGSSDQAKIIYGIAQTLEQDKTFVRNGRILLMTTEQDASDAFKTAVTQYLVPFQNRVEKICIFHAGSSSSRNEIASYFTTFRQVTTAYSSVNVKDVQSCLNK